MIEREHAHGPMFLYVYLTANHFPWTMRFGPDLTPEGWRSPGNAMPEVDEYLRRQTMSARDYSDFLARLKHDFPDEQFLIVRFGDHQPDFAKLIIDPQIDAWELGQPAAGLRSALLHDLLRDRRHQFPAGQSVVRARRRSTGPICRWWCRRPPACRSIRSFAEQKSILERCNGLFYGCADGAEARRFNRLLIDAGLIKGL